MRIKMFLLALVAALATTMPVQAGAVLGFAVANTQSGTTPPGSIQDPNYPNPGAGTGTAPSIIQGLSDFSLGTFAGTTNGGTVGTNAGNAITMNVGETMIIQVVMRDTTTFTFPNTATGRMFQWGVRLNYAPGVATIAKDPNGSDFDAVNIAVNDSTDLPQTNLLGYNNLSNASSTAMGNFFGSGWVFPGGSPHNYVLANFILTASGSGDAIIDMVDPDNANPANFSNLNSVAFDATMFATIPQLFIHVNPVPEPSSMALAGLAVSGLVVRLRRKKAVVAA